MLSQNDAIETLPRKLAAQVNKQAALMGRWENITICLVDRAASSNVEVVSDRLIDCW